MPGIYMILCRPTGEYYIGGTKKLSFKDRFLRWESWLKRGKAAAKIQAAYDEHGPESFEFIPLRELPPHKVSAAEQRFIKQLQPKLNSYMYVKPWYGPDFIGPRRPRGRPRKRVND